MTEYDRSIAKEVEQLANSRLPLWKRTWLKTKRYLDLNDSYPFPDAVVYRKRDKISIFLTICTAIGIVILLCYVVYRAIVVLAITAVFS